MAGGAPAREVSAAGAENLREVQDEEETARAKKNGLCAIVFNLVMSKEPSSSELREASDKAKEMLVGSVSLGTTRLQRGCRNET